MKTAQADTYLRFILALAMFAAAVFALPPAPARADVLSVESGARKRFPLDGAWKCSPQDSAAFSATDFDDSAWRSYHLPGDLAAQGLKGKKTVWCRRRFDAPDASFSHFRAELARDSLQVWINGRKLSTPAYPPPFDTIQFGVFDHIWTFTWQDFFNADKTVAPGRKNTIAVRITNELTAPDPAYQRHPDITHSGSFGVLGDIYLVSRPGVFIDSFTRVQTVNTAKGSVSHKFFLLITNSSIRTEKFSVSINIYSENGGRAVYSKTITRELKPGGDIVDFQWQSSGSLQAYRAVAVLRDNGEIADQLGIRFLSVAAGVENGKLLFNGEPFVIRGADGAPGMPKRGAGKKTAYSNDAAEDDLSLMARSGVNALRTESPTPDLLGRAAAHGIMAVPVLSSASFGKTIIALKEFPNILFWEIDVRNNEELENVSRAVLDLDPYRRPMALSSSSGFSPGAATAKRIGLVAKADVKSECSSSARSENASRASYLHPWNAATEALTKTWDSCIGPDRSDGAFLSPFAAADAIETIAWNYRELEPDYFSSEAGLPVLALRSKAEYDIRNLQVFSVSNGKKRLIASQTELPPGRNFYITNNVSGLDSVLAVYTTHGGLSRSFAFSLSSPAFAPDRFRFSVPRIRIRSGQTAPAELVFTNKTQADAQITVSLNASSPGVAVSPASRNVFVRSGDTVKIPFDVKLKKNLRGGGTIKAVAAFKNDTSMPLYASLPVTAK